MLTPVALNGLSSESRKPRPRSNLGKQVSVSQLLQQLSKLNFVTQF